MRIRLLGFSVLTLLLLSALAQAAAAPYYLALGDSLAIGVQPSPTGTGNVPTNKGYADDLYAVYRTRVRGLRLAKLGCSGETTTTMIQGGGGCSYAGGSQLAAAVNFLHTHRVAFVTLDIGANDIDQCISLAGIDETCVTNGLTAVTTNLPEILAELRNAAGPATPIFAMNYYDPFLAAWTFGTSGQQLAIASLQVTTAFNSILKARIRHSPFL
jgi:lysophospholipase L1-like esterase